MNTLLKLILVCSLCLNTYFIWQINSQYTPEVTPEQATTKTLEKTTVLPSEFEQAIVFFNNQQFDKAIEFYTQLLANDPHQAKQLKQAWQQEVEAWLSDHDEDLSELFLSTFLKRHPYDITMLKLDAKRLINQGHLQQGIVSLMALANRLDSNQQGSLAKQIEELVTLQINALTQAQQWQQLLEHSLQWLDYAPHNPYYLYTYAMAYYQLGDYVASQVALEQLPENHAFINQANELRHKLQQALTGVDIIELTPRGAHYLVNSVINDTLHVKLMIDTGASFTVINQAQLDNLTEPAIFIGTLQVNTANGIVVAKRYRLRSFQIGQQYIDNFDVLVIDNHSGVGLLGMNFLGNYKFNINQQQDELELIKSNN